MRALMVLMPGFTHYQNNQVPEQLATANTRIVELASGEWLSVLGSKSRPRKLVITKCIPITVSLNAIKRFLSYKYIFDSIY